MPYKAILIPDIAIGTDQNTKYLLIVKPDDTVEMRTVKIGKAFGKLRAISEGLQLGERVIVNGMQAAKAGTIVKATEVPIPDAQLQILRAEYGASALLKSPVANSMFTHTVEKKA